MTTRGWWLVLLSAGLTVAANLLLRAGVDRSGGFPGELAKIPQALLRLTEQPLFDLGVVFYASASLVWLRVVATEPLSTAYPLLVSLTFLLVILGAALLFRESLTLLNLIGLAIILFGIFIVSRS